MSDEVKSLNLKVQKGEVLGVVMARGGSVGLPGKALRLLMGKAVIGYTFEHVRESKLITRAVVSSDDVKILKMARGEGFEVIDRPGELATATSATDPVLRHAVRMLYGGDLTTELIEPRRREDAKDDDGRGEPRGHDGGTTTGVTTENTEGTEAPTKGIEKRYPAAVVMLYGNVPVRRGGPEGGMIDRCVEMLFETGCDSVQTIAAVGKMHPYWMFDRDGEGRIVKHVKNDVFRRQDLPPLYSPTGAVFVMRTEVLMGAEGSADPHGFLGRDRRGLVVGAEDSVDIDTARDLFVAEAMMRDGTTTM